VDRKPIPPEKCIDCKNYYEIYRKYAPIRKDGPHKPRDEGNLIAVHIVGGEFWAPSMSAPEPSSTWVEVPMTPTGRRYYVNLHTQVPSPCDFEEAETLKSGIGYLQETAWAIPDGAVVVPAKLVTSPKAEPSAPTRPTGDATTIKEGWLEKTNKKGKHWKKRWVVPRFSLDGNWMGSFCPVYQLDCGQSCNENVVVLR
jgi:hypothetical protein